ncbi:MAG: transcription-repair coupling factor [Thermoanaerobaculia bacterium]|nr:transcription-repair coupling factor [Thermoanaerobaculia bacterium]
MIAAPFVAPSARLRASDPYRRLLAERGDVVRLPVAAAAWVAELLREDLGRPLLVLVPRESDALGWIEATALFSGSDSACYFPAPSLTPYQDAAASLPVRALEALTLDRLAAGRATTVVATPRALFRRLPTAAAVRQAVLELKPGVDLPIDLLVDHLLTYGYRRVDMVSEVGELAVRGGILDVFPPGDELPLRVELFGDTVDTLRRFDPGTQRSEERVDAARVLPVALFPCGPAEAKRLADLLVEFTGGETSVESAREIEALRTTGEAPGWENFHPLLAKETVGLLDYLPGALVFAVDPESLTAEVDHHAERLVHDFGSRRDQGRIAVPPEALERTPEEVQVLLGDAELRLRDLVTATGPGGAVDWNATTTDLFQGQLPRFPREVEICRARGERCLVVTPSEHRDRLAELLEGREIEIGPGGVELVSGELARGFRLPSAGLAIYGEPQLLPRGGPERRPARRGGRFGPFVSGLRDLKVGDYVVHADHGVGQFVALRTVGGEGSTTPLPPALAGSLANPGALAVEVMEITYATGQRLLLPLSRLDQVQKFSGIEGVSPKLDKLGGTSWNKTKAKVKKSLRDMAGELLKLYAERQVAKAPVMPPDAELSRQFEAAFPYEETADQLDAIAAIRADLERERPMDRLLCGDVGYGKTEVAMRAAAKAVDAGFQVAVLAPTTILADQHLETFQRRFQGLPVTIEMVSRFRTKEEIADIRKRLGEGKVDILIGTHRLLSQDVTFPRLGLVIVDEEQRFGVAQKERLKQLKKDVHVLAMSATPVPRTLQLSLAGVRDLSVIETPPKDRMAVETAILPFNKEVIREAIEVEIERGGQVYYVYNRVESIEEIQAFLHEIVPNIRITVGHGQLEEQELSKRMHAFTRGDYDLLLATTIIENGIDIPNVNTMIVHRADRFGLAQLYQLRGRVGRSNQLAYCYLLVPGDQILTEVARKRLAAIREFTDLGAGFRIAARDLEIRGAGNLLGAEQSGHIAAVGIETYLKMLEDAVRELRGEAVEEEGPAVTIDLPVPLAIPTEYITDANLRMEVYRKIAQGEAEDREILAELADRFGPPPAAVATLLDVARLKRDAERLRVQQISAKSGILTIRLRRDARIDVDRLITFVQNEPGATFSPTGVLTVPADRELGLLGSAKRTLGVLGAGA